MANATVHRDPIAANAVADLARFFEITKTNQRALEALNERISKAHPIIDAVPGVLGKSETSSDFFLNRDLAAFL